MLKRVFALLLLLSMLMPIAVCAENAEPKAGKQAAREAAMLMGFTQEQLDRVTVKPDPVMSERSKTACYVFECPDEGAYDALRSCCVTEKKGTITITFFMLQPLMEEEAFRALSETDKVKHMLLTIMEQLPWLEVSETDRDGVYTIGYYTTSFEDLDDLPKYFTWKQTRVYKAGIDHPLAGKIVEISYYPQSESIAKVHIIPFQ